MWYTNSSEGTTADEGKTQRLHHVMNPPDQSTFVTNLEKDTFIASVNLDPIPSSPITLKSKDLGEL